MNARALLGDAIDLFDNKRVPLNSRQRAERQGPYPYYGAQGIIDHVDDYLFDGRYLLVPEDGENLNSRKLPIAFFATGRFWVNNHAHVLRGKPGKLDTDFLCYWLNNADISGFITGAAQPKLSQANLCRMEIELPPIDAQVSVAQFLRTYDDLIENNTRRIAILEEMARRIFEEWFLCLRPPNVQHTSTSPPKGWLVGTVESISSLVSRGITPSYDGDGPSLVINQKCIRNGRLSLKPSRRQSRPIPADKMVKPGDVLINSTGVGTLGRVAQVEQVEGQLTVDTHVTIVRAKANVDRDFFGLALLLLEPAFEQAGIGSTGQTELGRDRIKQTELIIPPEGLQKTFGKIARPIRRLAHLLDTQNQNLCIQRDLLLPKLISGEIDVSRAERVMEAAE